MATKKKQRPYSTAYQAKDAETAKRYLLSGIPPGLWRKFQARCTREHVAMRQVILQAVDTWTQRPAAPAARVREQACVRVLPGQLRLFLDEATSGSVSAPRTAAAATGRSPARRRRG